MGLRVSPDSWSGVKRDILGLFGKPTEKEDLEPRAGSPGAREPLQTRGSRRGIALSPGDGSSERAEPQPACFGPWFFQAYRSTLARVH